MMSPKKGVVVTLLMPRQVYEDDRRVAFSTLATSVSARPVGLRSALSNVFISMARQGRRRS